MYFLAAEMFLHVTLPNVTTDGRDFQEKAI